MDEEEQPNSFNNKLKPVSIDENGEPVYLLDDYLQHQIDETDAEIDHVCAVFGECNDVECSYNKGYLKRQALYACHTCIPESKLDVSKAAGVCLACSLHCHNGHDLVELYTKRNFRCDCGNSKFETRCTLIPDKVALNTANSYNQNFTGLYCTCARPYPDPDDDVEDDMISCALCEDWFHTRHLGIACPPSNSYEEMICEACVRKHDFLLNYDGLSMTKVDNTETTSADINVVDVNDTSNTETKLVEVNIIPIPVKQSSDQETSDEKNSENVIDLDQDNTDENLATEGSEQVLVDENIIVETAEEKDGVKESTSSDVAEDVAMDTQELVAISQQERNDICDNLDDISRQCEEIDKAVDDSTKQEALAAVSEDLDEQAETEVDNMDTTQSAGTEEITKEQSLDEETEPIEASVDQVVDLEESLADTQETTDQVSAEVEEQEEVAEQKEVAQANAKEEILDTSLLAPENKEMLDEKEGEALVQELDTIDKKEPKISRDVIQEGETKRNCKKPKTKSTQISTKFYESSRWRENLCICTDCTKLYTDNNVAYLLDPQDTLQFYKEFGREVYVEGAYGAFKRKFDSLPHTERIFLAEEMAEFKDKFGEFLKQCADEQRVITSEDVRTFFGNLDQSRKRRKVEMESNYYCR